VAEKIVTDLKESGLLKNNTENEIRTIQGVIQIYLEEKY